MKVNPVFKKIIIRATKEAGSILMERFDRINSFSLKKDNTLVSVVDNLAEERIISLINKNFPSHNIFGEEKSGKISGGYFWVVDALDGTTNYLSRIPVFSVSIALFYNKEPVLAAIYSPILKDLYFSEKGEGFFVNGKKVKNKKAPDSILALAKGKGRSNFLKLTETFKKSAEKFRTVRFFGSSALDLCNVAASRADVFVSPGADFWDVAAGVLMVREAGGSAIDFSGRDWSLKSKNIIASLSRKKTKLFLKNV